jgi:hypothetical protein
LKPSGNSSGPYVTGEGSSCGVGEREISAVGEGTWVNPTFVAVGSEGFSVWVAIEVGFVVLFVQEVISKKRITIKCIFRIINFNNSPVYDL